MTIHMEEITTTPMVDLTTRTHTDPLTLRTTSRPTDPPITMTPMVQIINHLMALPTMTTLMVREMISPETIQTMIRMDQTITAPVTTITRTLVGISVTAISNLTARTTTTRMDPQTTTTATRMARQTTTTTTTLTARQTTTTTTLTAPQTTTTTTTTTRMAPQMITTTRTAPQMTTTNRTGQTISNLTARAEGLISSIKALATLRTRLVLTIL